MSDKTWNPDDWNRAASHLVDRVANTDRTHVERREAAHKLARLAMDAWRELGLTQLKALTAAETEGNDR